MSEKALIPGRYYHIYNRGTNGEVLFKNQKYYPDFLQQYTKFITPVADTIAYCLMSNHFHFLIRTKDVCNILTFEELNMFEKTKPTEISLKKPKASSQFSHLFNSYSNVINKAYQRTGSLFEHPFKRRMIENENYLMTCISYIHNNPVKDGFVKSVEDYKWSSYYAIISDQPTMLDRDFVLNLFGGKENFIRYHGLNPEGFEDQSF